MLALAWDAVSVTVHFGVGTVLHEVRGFFTRRHLGAVDAAVAPEVLLGGCHQLWDRGRICNRCGWRCWHLRRGMGSYVELPTYRSKDNQDHDLFHVGSRPTARNP